jgi:predicted transglutaminase-like cysteine proteinase
LIVCTSKADESSDMPLLESINYQVNHRIAYADDASNWNVEDYWATPEESYARGAGDCEDIAIAKYFALRDAGLAPATLRLAYVELQIGGAGGLTRRHIVVAYLRPDGGPGSERVLDNVIDEVRLLSRRPDLHVLISFDMDGVWLGLERGAPARPARDIRRWSELLARLDGMLPGARLPRRRRRPSAGSPAAALHHQEGYLIGLLALRA